MDKSIKTSNLNDDMSIIVKKYYEYKSNPNSIGDLIKSICAFFDNVKDLDLNQQTLEFLYEMCNIVGIPQYYDMLIKYKKSQNCQLTEINQNVLSSMIYNSSLAVENDKFLHKYQNEVVKQFKVESENRFFLTAPTSFGKTFIVNLIIQKMNYKNICLIFPTLSLLSENYLKLLDNPFFNDFNIHTLSDENIDYSQKNIWVFTPERFLSLTDKIFDFKFDFIFMDEIYKIDNQFIIDQDTICENERDTSFRVALQLVCSLSKDILLAGPYIEIPNNQISSINNFITDNRFKVLKYNNIEIVNKDIIDIENNGNYEIDKTQIIISNKDKNNRIIKILNNAIDNNQSTIIYVDARYKAEQLANTLLTRCLFKNISNFEPVKNAEIRYKLFLEHLKSVFGKDWILIRCLEKGIAIHHGYIPKYIQKEIIEFFNQGLVNTLIATTTITEGVNTTAKNIIVTSDKKGNKPLKKFDAQNIAGRAGRFLSHFKGNVISINNNFVKVLNEDSDFIKNIQYDQKSAKSQVDIFMSSDRYLSNEQKLTKKQLLMEAKQIGFNDSIINRFKIISLADKIKMYKLMQNISNNEISTIRHVIKFRNDLNWDSFELILKYIKPVLTDSSLINMASLPSKNEKYCVLTIKVYNFLRKGFEGVLEFEKTRNKKIDTAVRETAKLTFNLFKYNLVKYLGLFDLLLRFIISKRENENIDNVIGINSLLQLLEYNSLSSIGKQISDYGVPYKVLRAVDTQNEYAVTQLDPYEKLIYNDVKAKFNI